MRKKILVLGARGFVGTNLAEYACSNPEHQFRFLSSKDCNLSVMSEFNTHVELFKPDVVINLAAKVGGIQKNVKSQIEFLECNADISLNVMRVLGRYHPNVRLIAILSTCIYPEKVAEEKYPMTEEMLEDGRPQPTNYGYAVGKRLMASLIKVYNENSGTNHVGLIPSNLYGPNDHFNSPDSHFVTSLIGKIDAAITSGDTSITLMGDGKPYRQFTYVKDLIRAIMFMVDNPQLSGFYNVATPESLTVKEIAEISLNVCGANHLNLQFTVEDGLSGQYKKDVTANKLGLVFPELKYTSLNDGILQTWNWYNDAN